jgi:hypothetical protein
MTSRLTQDIRKAFCRFHAAYFLQGIVFATLIENIRSGIAHIVCKKFARARLGRIGKDLEINLLTLNFVKEGAWLLQFRYFSFKDGRLFLLLIRFLKREFYSKVSTLLLKLRCYQIYFFLVFCFYHQRGWPLLFLKTTLKYITCLQLHSHIMTDTLQNLINFGQTELTSSPLIPDRRTDFLVT